MTEYEAASLALQQSQLWAAIAIPAVAGLVGVGQCWLIWIGIRRMGQAGDQRDKREDQRHAEAMEALRQQGRALDGQAEALRAVVAGLEQQGEALRQQGQALERQGRALEAALTGGRA